MHRARSWQDMAWGPEPSGPVAIADRAADGALAWASRFGDVELHTPDDASTALAELQLLACRMPCLEARQLMGLDLMGRRVFLLHAQASGLSEASRGWWRGHEHLVREGLLASGALEQALALLASPVLGRAGRRQRTAAKAILAAPTEGGRVLRAVTTAPALCGALDLDVPDAAWVREGTWRPASSPPWLSEDGQSVRDAAARVHRVTGGGEGPLDGAIVGLEGDTLGTALAHRVSPGGWLVSRAVHPSKDPWSPGAGWSIDDAATAHARAVDTTVLFGPVAIYRRATAVPGRAR